MKRRSNTKKPHDPHQLYLDEDISGQTLAKLLRQAKLDVSLYNKLLRRNRKIPDGTVLEKTSAANYILVTADQRMESDWTDEMIKFKSRVILLTDGDGGPIHWASAIVCSERTWVRVLLDHPIGPIVVRINRAGTVTKLVGDKELRGRRDQLLQARIVQHKRHGHALKRPA